MSDLTPEEFSATLQTILPILAKKGIANPTDTLLIPLIKAHLPEDNAPELMPWCKRVRSLGLRS